MSTPIAPASDELIEIIRTKIRADYMVYPDRVAALLARLSQVEQERDNLEGVTIEFAKQIADERAHWTARIAQVRALRDEANEAAKKLPYRPAFWLRAGVLTDVLTLLTQEPLPTPEAS